MTNKIKIIFDVQEFYYLAQYLPVLRELEKRNISCTLVIYENQNFQNLLNKAIQQENLNAIWVKDKHKALDYYMNAKAAWVIFGNHFFNTDLLHTVSKTAQFGHAIGIKKSYYTKSKTPMTIRFVEGERRLKILNKMYPRGNYFLTGFAKLDPVYNHTQTGLDLYALGLDPEKKTILYAPTFYPSSIELFPDNWPEDFSEYNILIKPHYFSHTKPKYAAQCDKFNSWSHFPNVYVATIDEHSLLPFMVTADILISEASSSIFEFAAIGKPIIWCDFLYLRWSYKGLLSFRLSNRLDSDILKFSDIGAHAKNYNDLKKTVDDQLKHPEKFKEKREKYSKLFVGPSDGKSACRIADYLISNSGAALTKHTPSITGKAYPDAVKTLPFTEKIAYHAISQFMRLLGKLPVIIGNISGKILGTIWYICDKRHRSLCISNLENASPLNKNTSEIRMLSWKIFCNTATMIFEHARFHETDPEKYPELFTINGVDNLKNAHKKGKGVLCFSGHLGNWELITAINYITGLAFSVVYKKIKYKPLDIYIKEKRERSRCKMFPLHNALNSILDNLNKKEIIGLIIDQNVRKKKSGVFINFIGRKAYANTGLAKFALSSDAPVIPIFAYKKNNKFYIDILPEVPLIKTGNDLEDIQNNTQAYNNIIEQYIQKYPEQWFWVHDRWKTQPPGNNSLPKKQD